MLSPPCHPGPLPGPGATAGGRSSRCRCSCTGLCPKAPQQECLQSTTVGLGHVCSSQALAYWQMHFTRAQPPANRCAGDDQEGSSFCYEILNNIGFYSINKYKFTHLSLIAGKKAWLACCVSVRWDTRSSVPGPAPHREPWGCLSVCLGAASGDSLPFGSCASSGFLNGLNFPQSSLTCRERSFFRGPVALVCVCVCVHARTRRWKHIYTATNSLVSEPASHLG